MPQHWIVRVEGNFTSAAVFGPMTKEQADTYHDQSDGGLTRHYVYADEGEARKFASTCHRA